jgi:hypothetical protein
VSATWAPTLSFTLSDTLCTRLVTLSRFLSVSLRKAEIAWVKSATWVWILNVNSSFILHVSAWSCSFSLAESFWLSSLNLVLNLK